MYTVHVHVHDIVQRRLTCLAGVGIKDRRFFLADFGVDSTDGRGSPSTPLVNVSPNRGWELGSDSMLLKLQ